MKGSAPGNILSRWWRWASLVFWGVPSLILVSALAWMLARVPADHSVLVEKLGATWIGGGVLALTLLCAISGIYQWSKYGRALTQVSDLEREKTELEARMSDLEKEKARLGDELKRRAAPSIVVCFGGFGETEYDLVQRLFPSCHRVVLRPLAGGFSGSLVFEAESWEAVQGAQQLSVVKLDSGEKIRTEAENYDRHLNRFAACVPRELSAPQYSQEEIRGGLRFSYARLRGGVSTFQDRFLIDQDQAPEIIRRVFDMHCLGQLLANARLVETRALYQEDYALRERDWTRITAAVQRLDLPGVETPDFGFRGATYRNPLPDAAAWFGIGDERENRRQHAFRTKVAVVHGDLNSRNILIDGADNVFVIDFAKTGPAHFLKDFCRLEVEIKFCLTRLEDEACVERAIDWEKRLLFDESGGCPADLRSLLTVAEGDLGFDRATTSCIRQLRNEALAMAGGLWDEAPDQYYLGLLYYTLDALRYRQCDQYSRLYALISASLLCHALG